MTFIHINRARKDREEAIGVWCYTCSTHTSAYAWFQEWYGWHTTCCRCGDAWADGELLPRPFERGWRERAARKASAHFERVRGAA